jgi:hypothetical protein
MTRLYINLSYTSPYFQRHKHILIQQGGILWSKHSCWIPYYEWKDLFQTVVPVEIGYDRLKQLQYDNLSHFRAVNLSHFRAVNLGIPNDHIYSKKVLLAKQCLDISWISVLLVASIVIMSLYYIYNKI